MTKHEIAALKYAIEHIKRFNRPIFLFGLLMLQKEFYIHLRKMDI